MVALFFKGNEIMLLKGDSKCRVFVHEYPSPIFDLKREEDCTIF